MVGRTFWCCCSTLLVLLVGCSRTPTPVIDEARATEPVDEVTAQTVLDRVAESYVQLVLALGQHDPDYVDAYYGPDEWSATAQNGSLSIGDITDLAVNAIAQLEREPAPHGNQLVRLRYEYLLTQLRSLVARAEFVGGKRVSFDEESRALYDATAPVLTKDIFEQVLGKLDVELPGEGSIQERVERFRARFVIPTEQLDAVFSTAIDACRARTAQYIDLPEGENFTVEYVSDKPWSGYNWYQGEFRSIIQVNTDLPIYIDRALDLACHEGYPGHHVYNVLLEKHLVRDRGWPEFTVYPLFSPQSLIAEGTANYGIQLAFPRDARIAFERDTLFPLAGLEPEEAARYMRVMELLARLDYAGNEAARGYLDGNMTKADAVDWLVKYNLMNPQRAAQRVSFFEKYRSYVINYNLGQDLVRMYIEDSGRPWERFADLISSPRLPSGLRVD